MARKIGFGRGGEGADDGAAPPTVRRSRRSLQPAPPPEPVAQPTRATVASTAAADVWGGQAEAEAGGGPESVARTGGGVRGFMLLLLWLFLLTWILRSYGGPAEVIWAVRGAISGEIHPLGALLPAAAPLFVGLVGTRLLLR